MKRYRILSFSVDTTRNILNIPDETPGAEEHKRQMKASLLGSYGADRFDEKFARYLQLNTPSLTVVGEFTFLLRDISDAYVTGSFYSALTGACCLGERILNDLILNIAPYHKSSPHYKKIHGQDSFNNWGFAINVLADWDVLDEATETMFQKLNKLRNDSVHYQRKTQNLIAMALQAINIINKIIENLFGLFRKDILLVFNVPGEIFIKKEAESIPLVRQFYFPSATQVGYKFSLESDPHSQGKIIVVDNHDYPDEEVTDEEFIHLRNSRTNP